MAAVATPRPVEIEPFQRLAWEALCGPQANVLLYGGARSGKTQLTILWLVLRVLAKPAATHAVLRHHFAHLKASIIYDTLPDVCGRHWPGQKIYDLNKSDWFADFIGGGRVYFGGLDDKDRTEKILGQGHCVDPASKILTADLRWIRADRIALGQEVVAFPEDLDGHQVMRRATVQGAALVTEDRLGVITDRGSTIVSANHGFVAYHDDRRTSNARLLSWRLARDLKPGDEIRYAAEPWQDGTSWESGWLAGMLDGEGWCSEEAQQIGVAQNAGPTLDRIVESMAHHKIQRRSHPAAETSGWGSKNWHVIVRGKWSAMRLLGITRPPRLLPKSSGLWNGVRGFNSRTGEHRARVLHVERLGPGTVVALQTSTKTFIADGFLGHNSSIYLNEASQISYSSYLKASTRLSQSRGLRLKLVCDENPPIIGHWTERLWIRHVEPATGKPVRNVHDYAVQSMNPANNPHIPEAIKERLRNLPPRERGRFWEGKFGEGTDSPFWTYESIESARVDSAPPGLSAVYVAIDPSGCHGPEESRSDEVGIVVVGQSNDGTIYVLEDASGRMGPSGPDGWGARTVSLFHKWQADRVIAETNFGGAMVGAVIRSSTAVIDGVVQDGGDLPFREVHAARGKAIRAEPVAALFGRGRVKLAGYFPELEEQLLKFSTAGYTGERSPDRADAMVWGVSALSQTSSLGLLAYYESEYGGQNSNGSADVEPRSRVIVPVTSEVARAFERPEPVADELVAMVSPAGMHGTILSIEGTAYQIQDGRIQAKPSEVEGLMATGFHRVSS